MSLTVYLPLPFARETVAVFVLALAFAECLLFCSSRGLIRMQVAVGGLTLVVWILLWYFVEPSTNPRILRPFVYFLFVLWVVATPLAIVAAGSYLFARIRAAIFRHSAMALMSVVVAIMWPFFALWSLCSSGLDCI